MKIKRFVAKDVRTALAEVKEFLGADAIILSNKKVAGGVEIVAATDQHPDSTGSAAANAPGGQKKAPSASRIEVTVGDENEPQPVDSLKALLSRQMQKQQNSSTKISAKETVPAQSVKLAPEFERQDSGVNPVQFSALSKQQEQQAKLLQQQLDVMRNEMLSMRQLLQHQVSGLMWQDLARREPVRALVIENLRQLGLAEAVADQIACLIPEELNAVEAWETALELLAGQLTTTNDDILRYGGVVALIGPTGVGKTTTVAKLAAEFAKRHGVDQVALVTTDCYRIGAYEQLATFGRIIGCPVKQAKDHEELALILNQLQQRKLILIDTAGMSQRDVRLAEKLASLVQHSRVKIRSYLVLSATAQSRVLQEVVSHFKRLPLSGCIFTKLDESLSLGELINVAIQNALPASYLTNGQRVPEDIKIADAKALVRKAEELRITRNDPGYQWHQDVGSRTESAYAAL